MKTIPRHPSSSDARGHPLAQPTLRPKRHPNLSAKARRKHSAKAQRKHSAKARRKRSAKAQSKHSAKARKLSVKARVGALGLVSHCEERGLGRLGSPFVLQGQDMVGLIGEILAATGSGETPVGRGET